MDERNLLTSNSVRRRGSACGKDAKLHVLYVFHCWSTLPASSTAVSAGHGRMDSERIPSCASENAWNLSASQCREHEQGLFEGIKCKWNAHVFLFSPHYFTMYWQSWMKRKIFDQKQIAATKILAWRRLDIAVLLVHKLFEVFLQSRRLPGWSHQGVSIELNAEVRKRKLCDNQKRLQVQAEGWIVASVVDFFWDSRMTGNMVINFSFALEKMYNMHTYISLHETLRSKDMTEDSWSFNELCRCCSSLSSGSANQWCRLACKQKHLSVGPDILTGSTGIEIHQCFFLQKLIWFFGPMRWSDHKVQQDIFHWSWKFKISGFTVPARQRCRSVRPVP